MIDERTLIVWANMQAPNESGCGDPCYGWYDEATPVVLKALGDDPDKVTKFIMTTSPEIKDTLGNYCDEIYEKFHTRVVYEALLAIIGYPEELHRRMAISGSCVTRSGYGIFQQLLHSGGKTDE